MRIAAFALVLVAALGASGAAEAPAQIQRRSVALPDCRGRPQLRPRVIVFTCADANFAATKLTWTGWGQTFAAAVGVAAMNDCRPDCADGTLRHYRVAAIATGRQTCPNGQRAYRKVTYAFIGVSPFPADSPGAHNPSVMFPCHSRP